MRQLNLFKILRRVLAQRAYEILGELVALINITADFTAVTFFLGFLRLGLDIFVIKIVCHTLKIREHGGVIDIRYKHCVRPEVNCFGDGTLKI